LASVLDLITGPVVDKSYPEDKNIPHQDLPEETNASTCVDQDLCSSDNDKICQQSLNEREQTEVKEEDCSSSRNPRDDLPQGDVTSTTCESRPETKGRRVSDNIVPASGTVNGTDEVAAESVLSYIPNLREGNAGLEEDPTLISRNDYLHFELDKDKIIVLQILAACKHSPDILQQYAIGQPRSDDLMKK